jgi:glycosyltransferase involved in cell wall biosynthesis
MYGSIGPTDKFNNLMKQIQVAPNLFYIGQISQDEINRLLSEGHVLVNTSVNERFPNTFITGWLRAVPVAGLNVDPDYVLVLDKNRFSFEDFRKVSLRYWQIDRK